jgi:hypothetical protein
VTWREVDEREALRLLLGEVPSIGNLEYLPIFVRELSRALGEEVLRVVTEYPDSNGLPPDLLHAMIGRTRVWVDLDEWKSVRGDVVAAAVVYQLTHSPVWAAAIAIARKLSGTVRALSEDEMEIVARIATAAHGDLYVHGASEQDLENAWPDDTALLHQRLDELQSKGVLRKQRDRWTVT